MVGPVAYRRGMTTADRYRRLSALFDETVTSIDAADWNKQSPCEEWTVHDVLAHVLSSETEVISKVDLAVDRTIGATEDPLGAWHEVRDGVQAVLDDPAKSSLTYESLGAETTIADSVDKFLCFDLIVHRWDIATAAGREITIPAEDIADANAFLDSMGSMFYDYGASAPAVPQPDDASEQDKLIGRAGRNPRWSDS